MGILSSSGPFWLCHVLAASFPPALDIFSDQERWGGTGLLAFPEMRCRSLTLFHRVESRGISDLVGVGQVPC